jgi:hypothetical protein
LQIDRYFNYENAVKIFFVFSIGFALSIPYIIEGNFINEINRGNYLVFFDMLGPIPETLISDTFTLDLMFWEPRGIELLMLMLISGVGFVIWYRYNEHQNRAMLCDRCGEQHYSSRFFFHDPKNEEFAMCLDCYYEVYGKFESEYEKTRESPEEKARWEIWGKAEIERRKEGIEYRKKAREEIKTVVKSAMDKMKALREEEEKFVEDYDDYSELDEENEESIDMEAEEFS